MVVRFMGYMLAYMSASRTPAGAIERLAPAGRRGEHFVDRLSGAKRVAHVGQRRDERVQGVAQHVLVGRRDVAPDAGWTGGQSGGVVEAGPREFEPGVPGQRA